MTARRMPGLQTVRHLVDAKQFKAACSSFLALDLSSLLSNGQAEEVLKLLQELLPGTSEGPVRASLLNCQGKALARLGRLADAIEAHSSALQIARRDEDLHGSSRYLGNIGVALILGGRLRDAIAVHDESARLSRQTGDLAGEAIDLGCMGIAYQRLGLNDTALGLHERALLASEASGDERNSANHQVNIARLHATSGDAARASEFATAALNRFRRLGDARGEVMGLLCLAEIAALGSDTDHALQLSGEAVRLAQASGQIAAEYEAHMVHSPLMHRAGQAAAAVECIRRALMLSVQAGDLFAQADQLNWLAQMQEEQQPALALLLVAADLLPDSDSVLAQKIRSQLDAASHEQVQAAADHAQRLVQESSGQVFVYTRGLSPRTPHH